MMEDVFMQQLGLVLTFITLPVIASVLSYYLGHMVGFSEGWEKSQKG